MNDNALSLETCDFSKPRRLAARTRRTIERWFSDGCTLAGERWRRLNLDVTLSHRSTQTLSLDSALTSVADPGWGMRVMIGANSFATMLACRPDSLRKMVGNLLGEAAPLDDDQLPLSPIEESMSELLFQELVTALSEAWPGAEPLEVRLGETIRRPRRTRLFGPRTTLTVATIQIESAADSSDFVWVIPQTEIEDLIDIECVPPDMSRVTPSPDTSRLVNGMMVPLTVELGSLTLSMTELSSLQTGDVIVLNQPSTHPLSAKIGRAMKFQGRPGRLGNRRCLEIEQVLDSENSPSLDAPLV